MASSEIEIFGGCAASPDSFDTSRMAVVGDSAGGNLAAVLALMARDRGECPVAAQVLIYPMLDATLGGASLVENALVPPFTLVDCVSAWQQYLPPEADRREAYICVPSAKWSAGTVRVE